MSPALDIPLSLAAIAAIVGSIAFMLTRRAGRLAGFAVWIAALTIAFLALQPWYAESSHCRAPATTWVPAIGAFAAASGAWVGIAEAPHPQRHVAGVALKPAVLAMLPAAFFLISLWPCG